MPTFSYEARTKAGEMRTGVMEADAEATVHAKLRAQQLAPVKVKKKAREFNFQFGTGVSEKDLVVFTRQFSTMLDAGVPIVQALDILANQGDNPFFTRILKNIKSDVEQGRTLSDALSRHPKVFDTLFVNLVHAGETGGILDTILQWLGAYIEKAMKLKRQIRGAMVYPTAVISVAVIVVSVLLYWVIPSFQRVFRDMGADEDMPALTQAVIDVSHGFASNLPIVLIVGALLFAGASYTYRTPGGKFFVHKLMLGLPIFGELIQKVSVARFTRTLGTLLGSGVPILEAMDIVSRTAGNVVMERAIANARAKISEGKNMADPLTEAKVFPAMVVQMIAVGEQTGALDQMLAKIADFYEDEVDVAVASLTSLMEPAMMVVIGGIVGTIIIAMYLPIFDLAGKVHTN